MGAVFQVTLPFFLVVGLGFWAARTRVLAPRTERGLNAFVFNFALPALFVRSLASRDFADTFEARFFEGYLLAGTLTFALVMAIVLIVRRADLGQASITALCATVPNVAMLGLPIILTAFGPAAIVPFAVAIVAERLILMPIALCFLEVVAARRRRPELAMATIEAAGSDSANVCMSMSDRDASIVQAAKFLYEVLRGVVTNPLILSIIVGASISVSGYTLPVMVERFLAFLGAAAAPAALFGLGAALVGERIGAQWQVITSGMLLKLFAHPLIACIVLTMLEVPPLWLAVGILMTAMPVAVNVSVTAQRYELLPERIAAIILLSTLVATVSVPATLTITREIL